jgi:hypothetical protein
MALILGHTRTDAPAALAPDEQRRFKLWGVVAVQPGRGSALISVDDAAPTAFKQGQTVIEPWRLESVSATGVQLSRPGAPEGMSLEMPKDVTRP